MKALVTGGYFDQGGDGVVWLVDLATQRAEVLLRWTPPAHLHVPTKGFAGGSLGADGLLYVAAHAAVVRIDPVRAEVTGVLHQPCMNDLHHVAAMDDRLYVSNTGLGAVDVLDLDGRFLGSHALLPAWANARRIQGDDFPAEAPPVRPGWSGEPPAPWSDPREDDGYHAIERRSAPFHRLKVPDHLHVNHVAQVDGRLLATCFADGALRNLHGFDEAARLDGHFLHDGIVHDDAFWLTAIDGSAIELDAVTLRERRRIDAFAVGHHGWCRGLAVTDDHLAIGLTEVRRARLPRHRWADRAPDGSETSVLLLDRRDGRLLSRVNLTDEARHAKLYSVLPIEVTA
ncbi:MAG: hypothetical protein H6732_01745 [Alphaproteobacteria bacterium]|nr:hypothetical protein [Alphaproteobacteria bacterium]